MWHLMFGLVVELDGKGNQCVRQQSRQREAILHGRNDNDNDNDKVRCDLKTTLLSPFLEPTEVSSIDARLESLVTRGYS